MHTSGFLSALALAGGVAIASGSALAQDAQRQPTQVPIELVRALVSLPYGEERDGARISVGIAPNGIAAANLPPKPVSILGGMAAGAYRAVVLAYPATDPDPAASYMKFLEGAGWARPKVEVPRAGFVPANELRMRPATLCRDSAHVSVLPVAGAPSGSAWVRADFYPERGMGVCTMRPRTDFMQEFMFPALEAPPGSRTVGTGGGGGSPDTREISTTIQTTFTATQLLAHYAAQLQKSGWSVGSPITGDSLSAQRVTAKDTTGREWSGALTVVEMTGASHVSLQMARRSGS